MSWKGTPSRLGLSTDAMVEADSVVRRRIEGGVLCHTPTCAQTYWGHRIETDGPPWDEGVHAWLEHWREAHAGRVARAVLAWETEDAFTVPELPAGVEVTRLLALSRVGAPDRESPQHEVVTLGPEALAAVRTMAGVVNGMSDPASRRYLLWYWDRAAAWLASGRSARYGVLEGGEIASSCGLVWDGHVARFQDVMTREGHRRRGFARSVLCAAMRARARVEPNTEFVIVVETGNPAEELYRSLGFEPRSESVVLTIKSPQSPKPQPPRSG
ncbi:MAG: GNAT family N-acetyltransferase [Sandaracinaceae bacterium]